MNGTTDVGVCRNRVISSFLQEWRKPRDTAFEYCIVWSLCNTFTNSLKEDNLAELPKRTSAALQGFWNDTGIVAAILARDFDFVVIEP
jgi:hypothetical protein